MSKELTEQWRNGELKKGLYYIQSKSGRKVFALHTNSTSHLFTPYNRYTLETKEVLDAVPTYDQFVELTEKVDQFSQMVKKVEQLEKRLKEAEEVIRLYFKNTQNAVYKSLGMNDGYYKRAFIHATAKEYLEKYGVEK